MYKILFSKQADKTLRQLSRNVAVLIRQKLIQLAENPYAPNQNVTNLQNRLGYRLRVGNWRIIYDVEDEQLIIRVIKIASRGDIYRS